MKKQKLTKLSLQRSTVSNLQNKITQNENHLIGGRMTYDENGHCSPALSLLLGGCNPTNPNTQGCSMECTAGCNDTFTCRNWSCDCNDAIV